MNQFPSQQQTLALATKPRRRQLISLTPLIDVVFILLIFFMLASSFLDWREIRLDSPVHAAVGNSDNEALLIEIRDDKVFIDGVFVTKDNLDADLKMIISKQPDKHILIKPAPGVPLQAAVNIIDSIRNAGATSLSLSRDAEI
jgi:biopolymer transport protein ExbD